MKAITLTGILLAVLGVLALVYQGFNYTREKNVVDVGPIHATVNTQEHVPLPPVAGGLALVAGVALLAIGGKQKP
jgi:UDP-N-acetylmuramyl pentapeptide phosphotransferase/UDP-N-acetylglucosamine-1-phosphate transferase